MLRIRSGYCGGEKESPSYYSLGNHTEAVSIDYDPEVTSYEKMLDLFWSAHRCDAAGRSRQYMNAVFYHDEAQKVAAEKSLQQAAQRRGIAETAVSTRILPVVQFTYAEAYHQKYYLTRYREIRDFLSKTYPDGKALADSTVAMRLNAYLGKGAKKDWTLFLKELPEYGLPDAMEKKIREAAQAMLAEKG